ncbi:MAG: PIN domain-containing protein [Endomicrobium sp.]|jgi:predicted nucleic acid-binding protein|nr:PIN domain-containing protein [Endomicrobium sp.]
MNADKTFIDTNILVYSVDFSSKEKQRIAKETLSKIAQPIISTQVLQELYSVLIAKLKLAPLNAKKIIYTFKNFETVQIDFKLIEQAIDISILSQISFWDALIVAAADFADCSELISEDLADGQTIRGVSIKNPFKN